MKNHGNTLKNITVVLLAGLMLLFCFIGCDSNTGKKLLGVKLNDYFKEPDSYTPSSLSVVDGMEGAPYAFAKGIVITQVDDNSFNIYNIATGSLIFNVTDAAQVGVVTQSIYSNGNSIVVNDVFFVRQSDSYTVYNSDGTIGCGSSRADLSAKALDTDRFYFDGKTYAVKDGIIYEDGVLDALSADRGMPYTAIRYNGYKYAINRIEYFTNPFINSLMLRYDPQNGTPITVYDKNNIPVYHYLTTSYSNIYILDDGNLLFQIYNLMPSDTKESDYTYSYLSQKIRVDTKIVDIKTGESKDIDTNLLFYQVTNRAYSTDVDFERTYTDRVVNMAYAYTVKDKLIVNESPHLTCFDNKLSGVTDLYSAMNGAHSVVRISDTAYLATHINNSKCLISSDGKAISASSDVLNFSGKFLYTDKRIYGTDLNPLCGTLELSVADDYFGNIIFYNNANPPSHGDYTYGAYETVAANTNAKYYFFNGEMHEFANTIRESFGIMQSVASSGSDYSYYTSEGELALKLDRRIKWEESYTESKGDFIVGYTADLIFINNPSPYSGYTYYLAYKPY